MTYGFWMMGAAMGVDPPIPQTVLSAINKAADIILSNGDRAAESTSAGGGGTVISVSGQTSGKFYFEAIRQALNATDASTAVGIHRGTSNLSMWLGENADGWGVWTSQSPFGSSTYHDNTQTNVDGDGNTFIGQRIRLAISLSPTAYDIWMAISNRSSGAWIGGGDPEAGTSPTYSGSHSGDTFYIGLCPRRGNAVDASNRNKLELALPGDWAFAAPAGFGVWT